jgi:translation initiation factor 2 subunit 2
MSDVTDETTVPATNPTPTTSTTSANSPVADDPDLDEFALPTQKKKKKKTKKVADEVAGDEGAKGDEDGASALSALSLGKSNSIRSGGVDYSYTELLERVFTLLREKNPNLATRKRHTMPPPQLVRVGTRKTMWANFQQITQLMHRSPEHMMSFLLAELGTEGSIDGNQRLIIKGRYQPKQIESLLKKYIVEYVTCHMCRNPETSLTRDSVTRLYFIQCESCGSRRSVAPIKSGFHATMRAERRKVKDM